MSAEKSKSTRAGLITCWLSLFLMSSVTGIAGPIMYGGLGGHQSGDSTNDGSLATIDQTTGAVSIVGHPFEVARISGLDFDINGILYGVTQGSFPFPPVTPPSASALIQINPITGELVSDIGTVKYNGTPINIADLAAQPGTGVLYGAEGPNDGLGGQGQLFTIDKTTGAATLLGNTNSFFDSIAFAPNGTLYLIAADLNFADGSLENFRLQTLNPGTASVLTTVSLSEFYGAFGIRPTDGVLFAGNGDGAKLFTLNPTTGAETFVGSTGTTFVGDVAFLTPEPASMGLVALGGLGLLLVRIRRRKPSA